MREAVPLLLVNIFTLVMSLIFGVWLLTAILGVNLTPLLATSAVFSIVLGLALQDTLGNLFAAVALQIDKPYEIGDWIEIKEGDVKITGQVQEISWRATVLMSITEELITIPNRALAQSQILNFAGRQRSFARSHLFRLPYGTSIETAKDSLLKATHEIPEILVDPAPIVIITETAESWITLKVIYNIYHYGSQFGIADRYLTAALACLEAADIRLASTRFTISKEQRT